MVVQALRAEIRGESHFVVLRRYGKSNRNIPLAFIGACAAQQRGERGVTCDDRESATSSLDLDWSLKQRRCSNSRLGRDALMDLGVPGLCGSGKNLRRILMRRIGGMRRGSVCCATGRISLAVRP